MIFWISAAGLKRLDAEQIAENLTAEEARALEAAEVDAHGEE